MVGYFNSLLMLLALMSFSSSLSYVHGASIQYINPSTINKYDTTSIPLTQLAQEWNDLYAPDSTTIDANNVTTTKGSIRGFEKYILRPQQNRNLRQSFQQRRAQFSTNENFIDGALDDAVLEQTIPDPFTFEGVDQGDNIAFVKKRIIPPDTVGDVGKEHYVQMTNAAFAVFDKKSGEPLLKTSIGAIWNDFKVPDCQLPNGDPIVLYDQFEDRWLLSQFTKGCFNTIGEACYNCIAISTSSSPLEAYHRYAVIAQKIDPTLFKIKNNKTKTTVFPDYPKYGVWGDSYVLTTRDIKPDDRRQIGISVYVLEKEPMLNGKKPKIKQAFLPYIVIDDVNGFREEILSFVIQPADVDGNLPPPVGSPIPLISYAESTIWEAFGTPGVTDSINIWEASVDWATSDFEVKYVESIPVKEFNNFPNCETGQSVNQCIPQPGSGTDKDAREELQVSYLDSLYWIMFTMHRVAYRNFGCYESLVFTHGTMALEEPFQSGMRWYEVHRNRHAEDSSEDSECTHEPDDESSDSSSESDVGNYTYTIKQQSTFAPNDGVHRWMGSIAQDAMGNIALGYSVSSKEVFPGIQYTGRLASDEPNIMTLGEGQIAIGTGVQRGQNRSRWGDYTSMNIDPTDDCTFWYTNQYISAEGDLLSQKSPFFPYWQTRIGSFKLPGCEKSKSIKEQNTP